MIIITRLFAAKNAIDFIMINLSEILEELAEETEGDKISLGEIVKEFENQGFGPLLLPPALIAFLPTGAIPGVPAICGIFIILVSSQLLIGKKHPWLPNKLSNFSFSREKLKKSVEKAKPWTKKIDKVVTSRLVFATKGIFPKIIALISILLATSMVPLEAIPFAVAAPAFALIVLSLGLSAKDGLLVILGCLLFFGVAFITWFWWPF